MRYFVESYGCTMNYGEGRMLSADMASMGYHEVGSAEEADIVILNTCTVVETTEKRMLARISELKKQGKEIVVTGCMAKAQPQRVRIRLPGSMIMAPGEYHMFCEEVVSRYGVAGPPLPVVQGHDAILPIAQGCLGNCSYCITRFARGHLVSYEASMLRERFNGFIDNGAREVLITAQDTACYGRDTGSSLPALMRSMLGHTGEYRLRIGMMNPNHLRPIAEELMEVMDDVRVYRFLHVPVQSGSNEVLKRMRRNYTAESFLELVDILRSHHRDISIATDMICGFPGETDEDHQMSLDLVRDLRADTVNITRFSPRPGTDAATMDQIHGRIVKDRSAQLTQLKNETEMDVNSSMVGRTYRALATERGKEGTILRTDNYRPVVVRGEVELGSFHEVEVLENRPTYLMGRLI